jgi:hypothetical protein
MGDEVTGLEQIGSEQLQGDLAAIATTVRQTAQSSQGKNRELLALLRLLEALHHEVREGLFRESLPDNRQALYALLRDIEANGGWPHIYRMRLQSLLINLTPEDGSEGSGATEE